MCGLRTLEDSDSRGEIVDAPGGLESGGDDRGRGDEIVGEAVVQVSLFHCQTAVSTPSSPRADPSRSGDAGGAVVSGPRDIPEARKHR